MLVLTRKRNEIIDIGEDIQIMVVEIRGDKVRLGIDAPREIPVHRREVKAAIERQQREEVERKIAAQQETNDSTEVKK